MTGKVEGSLGTMTKAKQIQNQIENKEEHNKELVRSHQGALQQVEADNRRLSRENEDLRERVHLDPLVSHPMDAFRNQEIQKEAERLRRDNEKLEYAKKNLEKDVSRLREKLESVEERLKTAEQVRE